MTLPELDLLTVGRANLDLYAQQVGVEFEDVLGFDAMVGGSPANIAIAAARLGLCTALFSAVGDDLVGDWVLRGLQREHVQTSFIARKQARHTSLALLAQLPPERFPLTFYRDDPADIHLTRPDAAALPLERTGVLLISGDALARGSTGEVCRRMLLEARAIAATVYVDLDLRPASWPTLDAYADALRDPARHADVVLGTSEEFAALLGLDSDAGERRLLSALASWSGSSAPVLVIKRGAHGALLIVDDERVDSAPHRVAVASTVGAGDAFAAGLISARRAGEEWPRAASFASACAAITVTRPGCSRGFPYADEVERFMRAAAPRPGAEPRPETEPRAAASRPEAVDAH